MLQTIRHLRRSNAGKYRLEKRSSRSASETDLSVGSDRTFTPIATAEGRAGGGQLERIG